MSKVILGTHFGKAIADMLGLKKTRNITIHIPYNDFVTIEVEALLTDEDSEQITGYMQTKRYQLMIIDEDEPIDLRAPAIVETTAHGDAIKTWETVQP